MEVRLVASGRLGDASSDPWDCNAYLLTSGPDALLVDSGSGRDTTGLIGRIEQRLGDRRQLRGVVLTHGHVDHSGGAATVSELFEIPVYAHDVALPALRKGDERVTGLAQARAAGIYPPDQVLSPIRRAVGFPGNGIAIGGLHITGYATAGHSYDHMVYGVHLDDRLALFTGDLVFAEGRVATSELPDCDELQIALSLRELWSLTPDKMFPGHGAVVGSNATAHIARALRDYDCGRSPQELMS